MLRLVITLTLMILAAFGGAMDAHAKALVAQNIASGEILTVDEEIPRLDRPQFVENLMGTAACVYEFASGRPKWPSRDPIEEPGGLNLHAMVRNDPVNWVDIMGLCKKGTKSDCRVIDYAFESENTHALEEVLRLQFNVIGALEDVFDIYSVAKAAGGFVRPGAVAGSRAEMTFDGATNGYEVGSGLGAGSSIGGGSGNGSIANIGRIGAAQAIFAARQTDQLPTKRIYLYMTVGYKECVCPFLRSARLEKRTASGRDGPWIGMPPVKGPLIEALEERLCKQVGAKRRP